MWGISEYQLSCVPSTRGWKAYARRGTKMEGLIEGYIQGVECSLILSTLHLVVESFR